MAPSHKNVQGTFTPRMGCNGITMYETGEQWKEEEAVLLHIDGWACIMRMGLGKGSMGLRA